MPSSEELERLADDAYTDRRITGHAYCSRCGYNLRTLPYIYRCPECGQEYNARPLVMKGLYLPAQAAIPVGDLLAVLLWTVAAAVFLYNAIRPLNEWLMALAVASVVLVIVHFCLAWVRFRAFFKATAIERRIRADEEEW